MNTDNLFLRPGTLRASLLERTAHARRRGAIQSIPTTLEVIEQEGVAFQVRVATMLERKAVQTAATGRSNPFLPYDPDLFVASISPTHISLLNKFNVVEHHLLIVTREFEHQETQLTQKDCEALLIALTEFDGLAFYNAGPIAGASQPHKHFQIIPLDDSAIAPLPLESLLRFAKTDTGTIPGLPFLHAFAPMDRDWTNPEKDSGASLHACYRSLVRAVGFSVDTSPGAHPPTAPYNLLVTRRWLLLVPRSQECFEGISINALGFAGAFFVKDVSQLAILRREGPMRVLERVSLPRKESK